MLLVHEIYKSLAVIITCYKYEEFLGEALDSVLSQSVVPQEIIIVEDSSDRRLTPYHPTECEEILEKYQYPQIKHIETAHGDPLKARESGFDASTSQYVCFLDADDKISPDYIEKALQQLKVADIIYSDIQYFGDRTDKTDFPANTNPGQIATSNFIHVGCVTKLDILKVSHAFDHPPLTNYHEDWFFWRKVVKIGFKIKKQTGIYYARKHKNNRSTALSELDHYQTRGTAGDTITFCGFGDTDTPFTNGQLWPAKQLHLNVYGDMPQWQAQPDTSVTCGLTHCPTITDRLDIINHTLRTATTDFIFFYNEELDYPLSICEMLLRQLDAKHAVIHSKKFKFLDCTIFVAPMVRNLIITSENDLKSLSVKYV